MSAGGIRAALLLHGGGGGGWEWGIWARVLAAAGIETLAPDLRPAEAGLAATTLDDYRQQAWLALRRLPRPRSVIGASLGGLLAAQIADDADALVLVNPLPPLPWARDLPARAPWPAVVPWGRQASLEGTRQAMPDADPAACLFAAARWRDESGQVLNAAHAGVTLARPRGRVLLLASEDDADVPCAVSQAWAEAWDADLMRLPGASHVGPLLGRQAASMARQAAVWLQGVDPGPKGI